MKKLFFYLLKRYSKSEEQRLKIHDILNKQVRETYTEQTSFGNVYNSNVEFILGNTLIRQLIEEKRLDELEMIEKGLVNSTKDAIKFIKNEPRRKKLQRLTEIVRNNKQS